MIWETEAVSLWTDVIWDIAQKISLFRFLAHCSPFWVSLWKMLWSGGRTTTRQSRLHRNSFSKSSLRLTPHPACKSRLRLRHCAGDRSERAVRRSTESCRGGGGKAQQSPWWREVAPRVELFPSLSVVSHTCWLSIRWMSQRTERILWFDLRGDLLRSVPFRTVWQQKMCFWFLKAGAKSSKLWLVYVKTITKNMPCHLPGFFIQK